MKIPENVLSWLIENNNPAVRYRTLTELLDYAQDHSKVIETQKKIIDSQPVTKIFSQIGRNGEWPWSGSYDSPELGIGYLGELGLDHTNRSSTKQSRRFCPSNTQMAVFQTAIRFGRTRKTPGEMTNPAIML